MVVTCVVTAALACAGTAAAAPVEVVPGVTYERVETPGQAVHVTRVTQGPLIDIHPILTAGAPTRLSRLTSAMRARLGGGAVAGVNGDYFNLDHGYPSGLLVTDREIVSEPEASRAALFFGASGGLSSGVVTLKGTWQAVDPSNPTPFPERIFNGMNRPSEKPNETFVYTPRYGELTPVGTRLDALIDLDPPGQIGVNAPVTGTVQSIKDGGGTGIGPGKLVLSASGDARAAMNSDLIVGRRVTLNFTIAGLPADITHAIGGGPTLVQDGVPIGSVGGGFTSGQIATRTSRTAVGQTADGSVLLVSNEGPGQGKRGFTMVEQARLLASLGARTAVGMDGGGSAMMAIRDQLVTPWSSERAIANAVVVEYDGVQLTPPLDFISPNGDGVEDSTSTVARAAFNGNVRVTLARPNGAAIKTLYAGALGPTGRRLRLSGNAIAVRDGAYRLIARFTPSDGSPRTTQSRYFVIDRTLGYVRLRKVGKDAATKLKIGFILSKTARISVIIKDAKGQSVKTLFRNRRIRGGQRTVTWDLKRHGKRVKPGIYVVSVRVHTPFGMHALSGRVKVTKPKPKPPAAPGA